MALNLNELNRVNTANTRSGGVDYDLAYSEKTQKFRVSPEMFDEMNMEHHGLTLLEDSKSNQLLLAVEPNEVAVMHRGRANTNKGREFKASRLRVKLDEYGFHGINEFDLVLEDTIEDIKYYRISSEDRKDNQPVKETPVDVPSYGEPEPEPESEAPAPTQPEKDVREEAPDEQQDEGPADPGTAPTPQEPKPDELDVPDEVPVSGNPFEDQDDEEEDDLDALLS